MRHPWRWVTAVLIAFLFLFIAQGFVSNPNMHWDVVGKYLFDPFILSGLLTTLKLTLVCMVVAVVLGIVIAVMRLSDNPVLSTVSWFYIWIFRGVPQLVQLLFWFFIAAVFPTIGIGIPFGPTWASADTTLLIGQFTAAVLGLGLAESAYMAEIVRAGLMSVNRGQMEAAKCLGMSWFEAMRRIVLPQAMRFIIPPTGNETINLLKTTVLVIVIALPDLLTSVQIIYSQNFLNIPLLTVACFWYLVVVSLLNVVQHFIEKHYGRGVGSYGRARSLKEVIRARLTVGRAGR